MKTIVFVAITFCLLIVGCSTPQRTSAPEKTVRPMDVVTMELRFRNQEDQDFVICGGRCRMISGKIDSITGTLMFKIQISQWAC